MKIVFLSVWYSEGMGYIENALPKALATLGHEVHVVTSIAQVYYCEPNYDKIYKPYLGDKFQSLGEKEIDGFILHRLPFISISNKIILRKIRRKLRKIKPDIVQSFDPFSFLTLQGAFYKFILGYKFFTANHTHASVFPLINTDQIKRIRRVFFFITRTVPGKIVSWSTSLSYPTAIDTLEIAVKYYGVPRRKLKLAFLGVDTDLFKPLEFNSIINEKRSSYNVLKDEVLCIYTGRFTEEKNPLCLAKAINNLVEQGEPFKALFMGNGPQTDEISRLKGCMVHEFVQYHELPVFYQIADIGVWPKQESTSMLDAAASGLPIIISDKVLAVERVEGNGLTYAENDVKDLMDKLLQLKDVEFRKKLSRHGVQKIREQYSWLKIAEERIKDYNSFIKVKK